MLTGHSLINISHLGYRQRWHALMLLGPFCLVPSTDRQGGLIKKGTRDWPKESLSGRARWLSQKPKWGLLARYLQELHCSCLRWHHSAQDWVTTSGTGQVSVEPFSSAQGTKDHQECSVRKSWAPGLKKGWATQVLSQCFLDRKPRSRASESFGELQLDLKMADRVSNSQTTDHTQTFSDATIGCLWSGTGTQIPMTPCGELGGPSVQFFPYLPPSPHVSVQGTLTKLD